MSFRLGTEFTYPLYRKIKYLIGFELAIAEIEEKYIIIVIKLNLILVHNEDLEQTVLSNNIYK